MEWVKRRREERQRRDAEQKRRDTEGFRLRSDSGTSRDGVSDGDTDGRPSSEAPTTAAKPATPIIQVSEFSPPIHAADPPSPNAQVRPIPIMSDRSARGSDDMAKSAPVKLEDQDREHVTQAIQVPMHARHEHHTQSGRGVDIFGDGSQGHHEGRKSEDSTSSDDARRRRDNQGNEQAIDDESEESEEDDDDDGFDDDDDDDDDTDVR